MIRRILVEILVVALLSANAFPQQTIGACSILPANNIWNTPVDTLPVLTNSDTLVNTIGANTGFHADFGAGMWNGGPIGIPFITVPGNQTKYPATFQYDDESDPGPYAVPLNTPIEGGSSSNGDRHAISIDTDNCILYELYRAFPQTASWNAGSGAIFDLKSNALRPATWTSADAAGLPIMPGLVTYEEILSGEIKHAIRFTAPQTRRAYVWPARHYASDLTGAQYPRMGERFRLKAGFNISTYPPEVQVILRAMKKYGIILADNGSAWFISGKPDPRWNDDNLHTFGQLLGSNFEAVDATVLRISDNSGEALQTGYEGDTAPRVTGDKSLSLADWVQTGRFAAGLDTVAADEFQRADCAPRDTRGNGVISIADWVQAGRYATGLDPLLPVGGPAAPNTLAASLNDGDSKGSSVTQRGFGKTREVALVASPIARTGMTKVEVWLEASGVENAIAFSTSFDRLHWEFVEAKIGSDAIGATLITNTRQQEMGRIGLVLAFHPSRSVAAGWRAIVDITLRSVEREAGRLPKIEINDAPVMREVIDVWGNSLQYEWQSLSGRRDKTK